MSVLTRGHGVVRGIAKGAKREKGAFSGGFDILARGRLEAIVKPGRDLATFTRFSLEHVHPVLRRRRDANRAAWLMADLAAHMLTDHDPHPAAFDALAAALDALEAGRSAEAVLLDFQWALLRETGYQPVLDRDVERNGPLPDEPTLAFSPGEGGLVADTGAAGRWRLRRETADVLRAVAAGAPIDDADPDAIGRAAKLLTTYVREIIGRHLPTMTWLIG